MVREPALLGYAAAEAAFAAGGDRPLARWERQRLRHEIRAASVGVEFVDLPWADAMQMVDYNGKLSSAQRAGLLRRACRHASPSLSARRPVAPAPAPAPGYMRATAASWRRQSTKMNIL